MNVQDFNYHNYQAPAIPTVAPAPATEQVTETAQPETNSPLNISQQLQLDTQSSFLQLFENTFRDQLNLAERIRNGEDVSNWLPGLENITPEQAYEMISEDGFWGVERTAQRLFDMAYSLSGGNPREMELLREAVISGFESAERAWGEDLPELSMQTWDRTLELFDEFAAGIAG